MVVSYSITLHRQQIMEARRLWQHTALEEALGQLFRAERQSARMTKITNDERLNPLWHRMLYSCTHMAIVGIKGLACVSACVYGR